MNFFTTTYHDRATDTCFTTRICFSPPTRPLPTTRSQQHFLNTDLHSTFAIEWIILQAASSRTTSMKRSPPRGFIPCSFPPAPTNSRPPCHAGPSKQGRLEFFLFTTVSVYDTEHSDGLTIATCLTSLFETSLFAFSHRRPSLFVFFSCPWKTFWRSASADPPLPGSPFFARGRPAGRSCSDLPSAGQGR